VRQHFPKLKGQALHRYVIRCIIDREVQDVIATSNEMITASGVQSADEVRRQKKPLIRYSLRLLKANKALRKFLYKNLYYHPSVASANQHACQLLRSVFQAYLRNPRLLGEGTAQRVKRDGLPRAVCDYLSGMTDRYLLEEHERLFSPAGVPPRLRGRSDVLRTRFTE
jgi:dGTPase